MGFPDGRVTALNVATGAVVWTVRLPGKPYLGGVLSAPAVSGNTLYIGNNDGHVYALDRTNGATVWSYEIGAWVASAPAVSGNALLDRRVGRQPLRVLRPGPRFAAEAGDQDDRPEHDDAAGRAGRGLPRQGRG